MLNPLFIDQDTQELFGIIHIPKKNKCKGVGIVMCPPLFGELIQYHRAYYNLATLLEKNGYHCLRFDYYGTGDSKGESINVDIERCIIDSNIAVQFMKSQHGIKHIVLLGARAGCFIVSRIAEELPDADCLILWDSPINGHLYIQELEKTHMKYLQPYNLGIDNEGVLGFDIRKKLKDQLSALLYDEVDLIPSTKMLMLGGEDYREDLVKKFTNIAELQYHSIDAPAGWLDPEDGIYDVLIPIQAISLIEKWLSGLF